MIDSLKFAALVLLLPLVTSCAGSMAGNLTSPDRRDFKIGDYTIAVVPLSDYWAAWWVNERFIQVVPPLPKVKEAEINAIEQYSGCKVVGAEFQTGSLQPAYLQAVVKCQ